MKIREIYPVTSRHVMISHIQGQISLPFLVFIANNLETVCPTSGLNLLRSKTTHAQKINGHLFPNMAISTQKSLLTFVSKPLRGNQGSGGIN